MNLYLKYRPRRIEELDLTSVRERLLTELKAKSLAHAYLFTGPRGAGKTSAARILARVANCEHNKTLGEPCNECDSCQAIIKNKAVDVLEIDAASNRGIDDVRELKDKIRLAPSQLKRKIYIIDEVHMMTTEAFNALLKTLEEPPEHALFILCTTEAHKVPETIVSRCRQVLFTKANQEEMRRSLARVVEGEKAKVSEEALELLAQSVDGSFRDGVKILDQLLGEGIEVGREEMERALFGAAGFSAEGLAQALAQRDVNEALTQLREGCSAGVNLTYLTVETMKALKELLMDGQAELSELIFQLDDTARRFTTSPVPELLMEVQVVKWCGVSGKNGEPQKKSVPKVSKVAVKTEMSSQSQRVEKPKTSEAKYAGSAKELWREMLKGMNGDSYSLGALLAKARPGIISGNELTIEVEYQFHQDQIMAEKHRAKIEELVSSVVGNPMRVSCEVVPDKLKNPQELDTMSPVSPEEDELLSAATEIFK